MRHLLFLLFVSLLAGCGLILDNSPPDLKAQTDASIDADGDTDAEPPVECETASDCPVDPCRGGEGTCVERACVYGEPKDCSSLDLGACLVGVCSGGECIQKPKPELCDDGVECTVEHCSESGECRSEPSHALCDDGVACTIDYCAAQNGSVDTSGCIHEPDDTHCGTLVPDGRCVSTICTGRDDTPESSGCGEVIVPDACAETAYCSLETGECTPFAQGCLSNEECDDGNPCNGSEVCLEKVCYLGAEACPVSFNPCLEAICTLADGEAVCDYRTITDCTVVADPIGP
jgi:hypothetical protein